MIKFHIPGIMRFDIINTILINLLKEHKEYFYDDISIAGIYGSFTPCLWNGGRVFTGNYQDQNKRKEIVQKYNDLGIGIIYTFTNTSVDSRGYADYLCNSDMDNIINNTDINKIIIADENLKQYIKNKYSDKDLKFILSITSDVVLEKDMKLLKELEDQYDLIVPNYNFNNTKSLLNTKNPSKYEILLNPQCVDNCKFEKEHYKSISDVNSEKITALEQFQCPYESNTIYKLENFINNKAFIKVEDLYSKYKDKGFTTFKINGRTTDEWNVVQYYLYYMVKPEYKDTVFEYFSDYVEEYDDIIEPNNNSNIYPKVEINPTNE